MALWEQFRQGAERLGVEPEIAQTVFHKLIGFSSYGFPKGHAAAFAVLAYQSCWLKLYYPAEFVCALLNNQPMGFYPSHVLVNDAKRHGIRVVPPDVNASVPGCSVEPGRVVRIGLGYVKGLREDDAATIVAERAANGPFRSLADFIRRVPLSMEIAERLIAVGAFDAFGLRRREALWQLGLFVTTRRVGKQLQQAAPAKTPAIQTALPLPVTQDMVELSPMPAWDRMAAEYQVLGLSPHFHPLGLLRTRLPDGCITSQDIATIPDKTPHTDGRAGGLPPAPGHRQGRHLPPAGGRIRPRQRDRLPAPLSGLPPPRPGRTLPPGRRNHAALRPQHQHHRHPLPPSGRSHRHPRREERNARNHPRANRTRRRRPARSQPQRTSSWTCFPRVSHSYR